MFHSFYTFITKSLKNKSKYNRLMKKIPKKAFFSYNLVRIVFYKDTFMAPLDTYNSVEIKEDLHYKEVMKSLTEIKNLLNQ